MRLDVSKHAEVLKPPTPNIDIWNMNIHANIHVAYTLFVSETQSSWSTIMLYPTVVLDLQSFLLGLEQDTNALHD